MNFLNRVNETFVLLCLYFIIMFTEIIDDVNLKITIGYLFIYIILAVIIFNILTLITYIIF